MTLPARILAVSAALALVFSTAGCGESSAGGILTPEVVVPADAGRACPAATLTFAVSAVPEGGELDLIGEHFDSTCGPESGPESDPVQPASGSAVAGSGRAPGSSGRVGTAGAPDTVGATRPGQPSVVLQWVQAGRLLVDLAPIAVADDGHFQARVAVPLSAGPGQAVIRVRDRPAVQAQVTVTR